MFRSIVFFSRSLIFVSAVVFIAHTANILLQYYPLYLPPADNLRSQVIGMMDNIVSSERSGVTFAQTPHTTELQPPPAVSVGYPRIITIERLGIALVVEPGYYDELAQSWTLAEGKAFYATLSDLPSMFNGNTIIYAHNQDDAFSKTSELILGDRIIIETISGQTFIYEYIGDEHVYPADDAVFSYKEYPRLTLLTCSGKFNETRRLMYARLVDVHTVNR